MLLLLLACMSDPAPVVMPPPVQVEIGTATPGQPLTIELLGIPDGATIEAGVAAADGGACAVRLAGSCSELQAPVLKDQVISSGGMASLSIDLPPQVPVGRTIYVQIGGRIGSARRVTQVYEVVAQGDCPDQLDWFRETVQDPVLSPACAACHTSDGYASFTRLLLTREGETPTWLEDNLAVLRSLASEVDPDGEPLLLAKPTNTHPYGHGGGVVLTEGTESYEAMANFVDWATGDPSVCQGPSADAACDDPEPGKRMLRRLTPRQFDRTVEDLLGVPSSFGESFAADNVLRGYANQAEALVVSPLLADQLRVAAEALSQEAVDTRYDDLVSCEPGPDCAVEFIESFGRRAFRRPLEYDEVERYYGVWRDSRMGEGFEVGIRWTIAAMLQSPHFLYRAELGVRDAGGRFVLTDHELATELSYTVLDTMPDEALSALADAGALGAPGGVEAALATLRQHPDAAAQTSAFVREWLHLDRLATVPRDADAYPDLTTEIRSWMQGETDRLVESLADGGTLEQLLDADHSYMTDGLAAYYGVAPGAEPADAEGYRRVDVGGLPFGGLLTQGSMMVTHAVPAGSSPIHRGVLVRERLLCQDLPPPPAALDTSPPEVDPSLSTRERYAQHATDAACSGCHVLIDPIGFAFEGFGGDGRPRTSDGPHPLDTQGEIVRSRSSNSSFDGTDGLAAALLAGTDLPRCYAEQWLTYAAGTPARAATCTSVDLAAQGGQLSLQQPLQSFVATEYFRARQGGPAELDALGVVAGPSFVADPADAEIPDPIEVTFTEASRWQTGVCTDVVVLNTGDEPVEWVVEHTLEGTIYNIWSAVSTADSGTVQLSGLSWNAILQPGQTASFGWCANL